ncbi:ATP-binding protein [Streptomyces sp. NBC_01760]|uniref:ATP-binding protein n=1 Tax=Streptomyces sp. NBC_01760 TaxID=2975931 RepID=UPI002DD80493|nr:ATP-binding protein [Streptomyces sp. NBC_01760]WSC72194.1 ATP-binding protein [Streptomyces sp. NBC_01760]
MLATVAFACRPDTVAEARSWATKLYALAGGAVPDACELLVSEVATNAVLHAGGPEYTVSVLNDLSIAVWDHSSAMPQRRVTDEESTCGRGLALLELLAPGYTVSPNEELGGKIVRFMPKAW